MVGAIVHADGQVPILHRSAEDAFMAGVENFFSGGVEPGKHLLSALDRALTEEIGWTGPLALDRDLSLNSTTTSDLVAKPANTPSCSPITVGPSS
ncbi:NUDIX domain-containing protein [Spirillospora sp. NPDC052242]